MRSRHIITFSSTTDIAVVALASMGRSTKSIMAQTGLSAHQISYRLTKAARCEGFKPGNGYRRQWRDGQGFAAKTCFSALFGQVSSHVRNQFSGVFDTADMSVSTNDIRVSPITAYQLPKKKVLAEKKVRQ